MRDWWFSDALGDILTKKQFFALMSKPSNFIKVMLYRLYRIVTNICDEFLVKIFNYQTHLTLAK